MLRIGEVSTTSFPGFFPTRSVGRVGENPGNEVEVSNDVIQSIEKTLDNTHITTQFHGIGSLRASSPIWASKASRANTRERAEKPRGAEPLSRLLSRASRASTFHDIPMESLLASYGIVTQRGVLLVLLARPWELKVCSCQGNDWHNFRIW